MSKSTKEKSIIHWWHTLAKQWELYASPAVPSENECQIIKKFIARRKKYPKILILGATPQFRDLAHSLKAEVTCVDISIDMILALRRLMRHQKEIEKEFWVRANWLTMPLAQNYFDFVLGDFVIFNIPLKLQSVFLAKIKEILKPSGYFITRHFLPIWPSKSAREVVELAIDKKRFNKADIDSVCGDFYQSVYNCRDYTISTDKVHQSIKTIKKIWQKKKDMPRKKQIAKLMRHILIRIPPGKIFWTLPKKAGEKMFKRFFRITDIQYSSDNPRAFYCPIYFLKKK